MTGRLWWYDGLNTQITDGYASKKYKLNGNEYKAGSFNLDGYIKNSNYHLLDYYKGVYNNVTDS